MTEFALWAASAFILGIFAGSLLLEGLVLVPFWRSLTPSAFFEFHHNFGKRLFGYFAPLTTFAVLVPLGFAIWLGGKNMSANLASGASLVVLAFFPLYFRNANNAFMQKKVSHEDLPHKLKQWANVHAVRTVIALGAFVLALMHAKLAR